MCKRRFKTYVRVGGEVLTNGITLCLLVIPSIRTVDPFSQAGVSFSSKGPRSEPPLLASFSSSRKGSLRRGGVICYLCAGSETGLRAPAGSAESITFISLVSAKSLISSTKWNNIAGARQGAHTPLEQSESHAESRAIARGE